MTTNTNNQLLSPPEQIEPISTNDMFHNSEFSTTNTMSRNQNKQKKRKQRGNKAKEVTSWDDIEHETQPQQTQQTQQTQCQGHWVPGTIPQSVINKMPWGDLDELTNEEFGYWSLSES
jgi:hypothetical protein